MDDVLPDAITHSYPLFAKFVQYYFEWKYRNGGYNITDGGISGLSGDELIHKSSAHQYVNTVRFPRDVLLERHSEFVESSDEYVFVTADEEILCSEGIPDQYISTAISEQGMPTTGYAHNLNKFDGVLFARLLPHINAAKGTVKAAELLFAAAFGEKLSDNIGEGGNWVAYPSLLTTAVDYDTDIDGESSLRDDALYNEYSFVINTKHPQSYYEPFFSDVYMRYFHPSGFGCFLNNIGS